MRENLTHSTTRALALAGGLALLLAVAFSSIARAAVTDVNPDGLPGEPQSLAETTLPGLLVVRSLTKLWSIPGVRAGYVVSDVETVAGLVIETHGDLPAVGTIVRIDLPERASETVQGLDIERWLAVEVVEVDRHVPSQLTVHLHEVDRDADAADEAPAVDEEVAR